MAFSPIFKIPDAAMESSERTAAVISPANEMTVEEKRSNLKMFLGVLKNEIYSEKLPPAIDKLQIAYERLGELKDVTMQPKIVDDIVSLQSIVKEKLFKLQNGGILNKVKGCGQVFMNCLSNFAQMSPVWGQSLQGSSQGRVSGEHAPVEEAGFAQLNLSDFLPLGSSQERVSGQHAPMHEAGVVQLNSSNFVLHQYELENGERVSEVVKLSRSLDFALSSQVTRFHEVTGAADNLDRICHGAFGFSFYSDEFLSLCSLMAKLDQNLPNSPLELQELMLRIEDSRKREFVMEISRDQNLRTLFRQLKESVLDKKWLFHIIAMFFVKEILSVVKVDYQKTNAELVLESLESACDVFLQTQLSRDLSSEKAIREGIRKLMSKLYLMKSCIPSSSNIHT